MWVTNRFEELTVERAFEHFVDSIRCNHRGNWLSSACRASNFDSIVCRVKQPVLIPLQHGILKSYSEEAAKVYPNCRLVDMPDCTRGLFDCRVERLLEVILPFVDIE